MCTKDEPSNEAPENRSNRSHSNETLDNEVHSSGIFSLRTSDVSEAQPSGVLSGHICTIGEQNSAYLKKL